MLNITISPTALFFNGLSDELYATLKRDYDLTEPITRKGYCIIGAPHELYKILLKLSYTYDIELS